MLKKLRCWLFGHDWKQQGFHRMHHKEMDRDFVTSVYRDHLLYLCKYCHAIKEVHLDNSYYPLANTENEKCKE